MNEKKLVWIDTDPAFGDAFGDPDDGFAMIALLNASNIEVCGISSVFANTGVDNADAKIRALIRDFCKDSIAVYKGDDYPLQLNHHKKTADKRTIRTSEASQELSKLLEELPSSGRKLNIVALGSMVNIATVLLQQPELAEKIEQVVVVAGRNSTKQAFLFGNDPTRAFRDLNFDVDPMAFLPLLSAEVPVVLAGVEVSLSMVFNEDDMEHFQKQGDAAIRFMASQTGDWIQLWKGLDNPKFGEPKYKGFHPFDLFAAAWVINPLWFEGSTRMASIESARDDTEFEEPDTVFKLYLTAQKSTEIPGAGEFDAAIVRPPWHVFYLENTVPSFKDEIVEILMSARPEPAKDPSRN